MDWSSFTIGNAAGFVKGPGTHFDDLLRAPDVTDITIGSITLEPRDGNTGNVYWYDQASGTSLNALGMPNGGKDYILEHIDDLRRRAHSADKTLRLSIAGFKPSEYGLLFDTFRQRVDTIELNLGCPNVWGGSGQKPIAAFDVDVTQAILRSVLPSRDSIVRVAVKLSPYSDPSILARTASVVRTMGSSCIDELILCNTFPNGLAFPNSKRALSVPYGGIGGAALRHIALGQVEQFASLLQGTGMQIIGVGGISRGEDILAMQAAGASGIQVGTAFGERGARIFSEILQEAQSLSDE